MSAPPTVPPSTASDNNYSYKLNSIEIIAEELTDKTAIWSHGTVTNLNEPIQPQDAATKKYVLNSSMSGGSLYDIQFNSDGFAGSNNFTFVDPLLTVQGTISDLTNMSITGGLISGAINPVLSQQLATKAYVDSYSSQATYTVITSDTNVTYTAQQMLNGIINRDTETPNTFNVSLIDTTATADQLVAAVSGAKVGTYHRLRIINDKLGANGSTIIGQDFFKLTVIPGTGVTFYPETADGLDNKVLIPRSYVMDAFIYFNNVIVPAVTIIISSISNPIGSNQFYANPFSTWQTYCKIQLLNNYLTPILPGTVASSGWTSEFKLIPILTVAPSFVGYSVAIGGIFEVFGGPFDDGNVGAVWVFNMSTEVIKLTPSDHTGSSFFGASISLISTISLGISNFYILAAGGPLDHANIGAVWIYNNSGPWTEIVKLVPTVFPEIGAAEFGTSVSLVITGNPITLATGGPLDNTDVGAVWIYQSTDGSGTTWTELAKLVPSIFPEIGPAQFGTSVSMQTNGSNIYTLAVGAPNDNTNVGAVWIYQSINAGLAWTEVQKLVPVLFPAIGQAQFGRAVSLTNNGNIYTLAVGAYADNTNIGAKEYRKSVFSRSGSNDLCKFFDITMHGRQPDPPPNVL